MHERRRRDIALLVLVYAGVFAFGAFQKPQSVVDGPNWQGACLSGLAICLAAGLWFAREWSRLACATGGLLLSATYLTTLVGGMIEWHSRSMPFNWVGLVFGPAILLSIAALWAAIGIYCLRRSTRHAFAEARERMARARVGRS